jgi:hypothetical protein
MLWQTIWADVMDMELFKKFSLKVEDGYVI